MTVQEIILIGIGLSMDAVAVSITNVMVYRNMNKMEALAQPLLFGFFQGIMPLAGGLLAGGIFAEAISTYAGIIIFAILGVIGVKMLKDGYANHKNETCTRPLMSYKLLFFQGIATSVDAFAVGIGLSLLNVKITSAAAIIATTTFFLVTLAILPGKKFGEMLGCRAEMLGGVILIAIGLKAMFV